MQMHMSMRMSAQHAYTHCRWRARINVGTSFELHIDFRPLVPQPLETVLRIKVRGAKDLTLPIVADVRLPDVRVVQDEFNFGGVYLGATHRLQATRAHNDAAYTDAAHMCTQ